MTSELYYPPLRIPQYVTGNPHGKSDMISENKLIFWLCICCPQLLLFLPLIFALASAVPRVTVNTYSQLTFLNSGSIKVKMSSADLNPRQTQTIISNLHENEESGTLL